MKDRFSLSPLGWLLIARVLPGLVSIGLASTGSIVGGAICLACASVGDLLLDSWASRDDRIRTKSDVQIEGFVDFTCFVWAPVEVAFAVSGPSVAVQLAAMTFALAGAFRLARFNVEGMWNGGYRGLPVTYSGVAVPLFALLCEWTRFASPSTVMAVSLVVLAILMVARFRTPRLSV